MKITLVYANFPFWRAEVARISLYMGGVEFNDMRITSEKFQQVKLKGCLDDGTPIPFHQLPVLVVDGVSIAQTGAIARFCGKLTNLYPKNNDLLAAKIDQFIDFSTDITSLVFFTSKNVDEEQKLLNRRELAKGELQRKLSMLENNVQESDAWICGAEITIADLAVWRVMGWLVSGAVDGLPKTLLDNFPKVKKICNAVDKHPKVLEWISLTYPKDYSRGSFE